MNWEKKKHRATKKQKTTQLTQTQQTTNTENSHTKMFYGLTLAKWHFLGLHD